MPPDIPPSTPEDDLAALAALAPAALDAWLRAHLSRQAVAALLTSPGQAAPAIGDALRPYTEIRLLTPTPADPQKLLSTLAPFDPDILLLWRSDAASAATDAPNATVVANSDAVFDSWPRAILAALDDLGLRERFTVLLLGSGADRATARRLGCEDGFPPATPIAHLAAYIARAALANDDYRRHGTSPPCYL